MTTEDWFTLAIFLIGLAMGFVLGLLTLSFVGGVI